MLYSKRKPATYNGCSRIDERGMREIKCFELTDQAMLIYNTVAVAHEPNTQNKRLLQ